MINKELKNTEVLWLVRKTTHRLVFIGSILIKQNAIRAVVKSVACDPLGVIR